MVRLGAPPILLLLDMDTPRWSTLPKLSLPMTPAQPLPTNPAFEKLYAGKPLEFPPFPTNRAETPEEKAARTIPAHWLELLAEGHKRIVSVPIRISNAIIDGSLELEYVLFESTVSIVGCHFTGTVDLSFTTFQLASRFDGSHFLEEANFRAAHADFDLAANGAHFYKAVHFQDLHVDEMFAAAGANFAESDFQRIEVGKDLFFRTDPEGNPVNFRGRARFSGAHIVGDANFSGAMFDDRAEFQSFKVDGDVSFCTDDAGRGATFGGTVNFNSAYVAGNTTFKGATFKDSAWFDAFRFGGPAFFRADDRAQPVTFAKLASFPSAEFALDALFNHATFEGPVDFDNAHFNGVAKFDSAEFGCDAKASFIGTRFEHDASFDSSQFRGETVFDSLDVSGSASFVRAVFGRLEMTKGLAEFISSAAIENESISLRLGGSLPGCSTGYTNLPLTTAYFHFNLSFLHWSSFCLAQIFSSTRAH
jgi:hypothetical protein